MASVPYEKGDGVIYLNIGTRHLVHLAVSLYALRKIYDGPVAILSGDECVREYIAGEKRLGDHVVIEFDYASQRTNCYHAKTTMHHRTPFERTVFLDADTLPVADFSDLWPAQDEFVHVTQFANWTTLRPGRRGDKPPKIAGRILNNAWPELFPAQVEYQVANEYPAINTGVLGFSKTSQRFMDKWHEMTTKQWQLSQERREVSSFITDELACQLLIFEYPNWIFTYEWNASPVYCWEKMPCEDVRIWHGHGAKFFKLRGETECGLRRQNSLWLPFFFEAMRDNWCNLPKWHDSKNHGGAKRPSKYVTDLMPKYEHWLRTGEIPLRVNDA